MIGYSNRNMIKCGSSLLAILYDHIPLSWRWESEWSDVSEDIVNKGLLIQSVLNTYMKSFYT